MKLKRFNDIVNENTEFEFGEDPQNDLEYFIIVKDRNGEVSFEEIELDEDDVQDVMEYSEIESRSDAIQYLLKQTEEDYGNGLGQGHASVMVLNGDQMEQLVYKMHPNH